MRHTRQPRRPRSARTQALNASLFAVYATEASGAIRWPQVTITPAVATIRLPHRLESPNAWIRKAWREQQRARRAWSTRLEIAIDRATPSRLPRPLSAFPTLASRVDWLPPTNRPTLTVTRLVPSRRNFLTDFDDEAFAAKWLVDALVEAGFISNDRTRDIERVKHQAVSPDGLDWTEIVIDARPLELRTEVR